MLTSKQKALAELMVAEPNLRYDQYAERVGISTKTCYVYRQNPELQDYVSELCKKRFRHLETLAIKKLEEQVDRGNFKAVQYVLDNRGYKVPEESNVNLEGKMTTITIDYGN
jgi:hypothetical protein